MLYHIQFFCLVNPCLFFKLFLKKKYFNENLTLPDNCLVFDLVAFFLFFFQSNVKGEMMLLATDFSSQLTDQISTYLNRFNSIPAFLSNITLELFNRQTQTIVIN